MNKRISDEQEQEIMQQQEQAGHAPPPTDFGDLEGALAGVIGGGIAGFATDALFGDNDNDGEERQPDFGGEDEDAGAAWRGQEEEYQQQEYPEDEHQFEMPEEVQDVGDAIENAVEEFW
jgi:hypothetical protein